MMGRAPRFVPHQVSVRICDGWPWVYGAVFLAALISATPVLARDAAFLDPGTSINTVNVGDAVKVEPKNEIDIGDSAINVSRRTTLFFINQTAAPIQVEKMVVNSDSNVTAEIANDDCSKQVTLAPASRCSVEVVTTPTGAGAWSVEALMTHNGAGRLARVKITGKTSGAASGDKKDMGLFLSSKDAKPVDFGEVTVGEGKTVRSALMVNDSPSSITIYAIDVIEADNGLRRLEQGCAVDMELKPGESCPVTLIWAPETRGRISTDLIIRHSGQTGFAVVPIRGIAKGAAGADDSKNADKTSVKDKDTGKSETVKAAPPPLPSAADLEKAAAKLPPLAASTLSEAASNAGVTDGALHLIGTVGNKALLFKPDGSTVVAKLGDQVNTGSEKIKIIAVSAKSVTILSGGKPQQLVLEAVQELTDKAKGKTSGGAPSPSGVAASESGKLATPSGAPEGEK